MVISPINEIECGFGYYSKIPMYPIFYLLKGDFVSPIDGTRLFVVVLQTGPSLYRT